MQGERLTPEEDEALRRLHWFEQLGCELSQAARSLKDSIRSRDRRLEIREPGAAFRPPTQPGDREIDAGPRERART